MERLTFDGLFCDIAMCSSTPGGSFCEDGPCSQRKVWERLKAYEDLEEQGRLVVLPCRVGDTVYEIDLPEYGVIGCKVRSVLLVPDLLTKETVTALEVEVVEGHGMGSCYDFDLDDFGKTVFLTREEAEAALAADKNVGHMEGKA